MTETVDFFVAGAPATKGSHRVITKGKGGRLLPRPLILNDNPREKNWAAAVAGAAQLAMAGRAPLEGCVEVHFEFRFQRPKGHFRANGDVKPSAPERPAVKPDHDKICRSTGDALNGIVYRDDAQVVRALVEKIYTGGPIGVRIVCKPFREA